MGSLQRASRSMRAKEKKKKKRKKQSKKNKLTNAHIAKPNHSQPIQHDTESCAYQSLQCGHTVSGVRCARQRFEGVKIKANVFCPSADSLAKNSCRFIRQTSRLSRGALEEARRCCRAVLPCGAALRAVSEARTRRVKNQQNTFAAPLRLTFFQTTAGQKASFPANARERLVRGEAWGQERERKRDRLFWKYRV